MTWQMWGLLYSNVKYTYNKDRELTFIEDIIPMRCKSDIIKSYKTH